MHALIPDPSLYPAEPFRRALNRALARGGPELLLYGSPQGDASLREVLAERLRDAALPIAADELVLCHGASQGIALALRLFCAPGDVVALEEPTYNNVLGAALALGPAHRAGADARRRRRSRAARADARAARGEGVLHDPDLPQPDGHHHGPRASPRAARRSRGARACP